MKEFARRAAAGAIRPLFSTRDALRLRLRGSRGKLPRIARPRIYLMEQFAPIFAPVRSLPGAEVDGSEYLRYQYRGSQTVRGIRHEDVMNLSGPDASFDLIVSTV